jgi:hypothetical protein
MIQRSVSSRLVPLAALLACASFLAAPAQAQIVEMLARCDGAQETPPVPSQGRGIGVFSVNTVTGNVDYRITFIGLGSPETLAHVHGFAGPGTPAGILFTLPLGSPKCGSFTLTTAQVPQFLAGQTYVNIHTVAFGGGEIRGQISELESHATFCHGDGSGTLCPCANLSIPGENEGCLHSFGTGGRLVAYGSASLANDRVVLHYLRGPATSPVLFFQGTTQVGAEAGAVFGDGLRCTAGNVRRLGLRTPCVGQVALPEAGEPRLSAIGGITAPGTFHYQGWFRNAAAFCGPSTFNLTNAVTVNWVP